MWLLFQIRDAISHSSSDEGSSDDDETVLKSTPTVITIDVSDTPATDVATQSEPMTSSCACKYSAVLDKLD